MAKLHKSNEWMIIAVSDDQKIAQEEANGFANAGYITKVKASAIHLTENHVQRMWRNWQKHLEKRCMREDIQEEC